MAHTDTPPPGPDLAQGVPLASMPATGVLAGHVDGTAVLLARLDDGIHAVSGTCTHYGAPLAEGLVVDGEIRCPWHHACFSLRTGAALRAPAFAPLATWQTDIVGDMVFVRGEDTAPRRRRRGRASIRNASSSSAVARPDSRPRSGCASSATTAR